MAVLPQTDELDGKVNRASGEASDGVIVSTSPATGRKLGEVRTTSPDAAPEIIARARRAQEAWFKAGLHYRVQMLHQLKNAMHRNLDLLIHTLVAEQGRPPFETAGDVLAPIEQIAYYVRTAAETLAPRRVLTPLMPHHIHWIERRPYGVSLVISPWNFPYLLTVAPIVAALVTGNTVVFKPSEFATQTGEMLARCIYEAGIPRDVFQIVHGKGELGAALIRAKPDHISFTGSAVTGRRIAQMAGELLIPLSLELGAKDAAIVLEDADLDRAAHGIVWSALYNAGQACASVERVYVRREVFEPLVQKMTAVIQEFVKVGPGEAPGTTMGAITTDAQVRIIERQVNEAVAQGAKVVIGGQRLSDANGRYYLPTILTNVTHEMRIMHEETFGPVIPVVPVDSDEEAVQLANSLPYGLVGSVWTRNRERGLALAACLEVGQALVNDHLLSSTTPQLPWGGVKNSGYGRTRGREGLWEMTYARATSVERFAPLPREFFWYPYTHTKYALLHRFIRVLYAPTIGDKIRALFGR